MLGWSLKRAWRSVKSDCSVRSVLSMYGGEELKDQTSVVQHHLLWRRKTEAREPTSSVLCVYYVRTSLRAGRDTRAHVMQ
jgi:hypothetical protein